VLRLKKKNDNSDPGPANDPIAAPTQIQATNLINGNVNPAAMSQLPIQGPPMPGPGQPGFPGSVAQYPMHHYGIPGYPYAPTPYGPHGLHPFSFPQHYVPPHGPSRKRRYNYNRDEPLSDPVVSDDAESTGPTNVVISYPLVSDWLIGLASDEIRGRDKIPYAAYTEKLADNGILRLDDLTRFSPTELRDLAFMNIGTAARIADWAKADKSSLELQERKGKKIRV
jgi:hypothetical protein